MKNTPRLADYVFKFIKDEVAEHGSSILDDYRVHFLSPPQLSPEQSRVDLPSAVQDAVWLKCDADQGIEVDVYLIMCEGGELFIEWAAGQGNTYHLIKEITFTLDATVQQ